MLRKRVENSWRRGPSRTKAGTLMEKGKSLEPKRLKDSFAK